MAYYRQPPKRRKSFFGGLMAIVLMTLFGVINDQTRNTLR